MDANDVITKVIRSGVILFLDKGQLRYKAEKGGMTPELLEEIKSHKAEIIRYLEIIESNENSAATRIPDIKRYEGQEPAPLSFSQQRLWFIDQLEGGTSQFNITCAFRLLGKVNKEAIKNAFRDVIQRHQVLRTSISAKDGAPVPVMRHDFKMPIEEIDLSKEKAAGKKRLVKELIDRDVEKVFDLGREILIQLQCVKLSAKEHVMLFNMHHIASDGWSMDVLVKEFSQLYTAYHLGKNNPLPPLEIQYADYAHWQRSWLQGVVLNEQLAYWKSQLNGIPAVHRLPLDKARPAQQAFEGKYHDDLMSPELSAKIKDYCKASNVTLFMFLQTGFSVLLGGYSGESDIVIGTPVAGRNHVAVEGLIGFFLNTLILRVKLEASQSFEELLAQNKQTILDAYTYQHVPYELLVEELKPERNLSYNPVYQVKFVVHNHQQSAIELPEVTLSALSTEKVNSRFDLDLSVIDGKEGLELKWTYKAGLFEEATIERMAWSFRQLVEQVLLNPAVKLDEISLLSAVEKKQLDAWQGVADMKGRELSLPALVKKQAAETPSNTAVLFKGKTLSYAALNEKAGRLAGYLLEQGIGKHARVGLCLERSAELMVALLGVMKSGAAYVPLDPNQKGKRVKHILEDAGIEMVLVQQHLTAQLPLSSVDIMVMDASVFEDSWLQEYRHEDGADIQISPEDTAYILYTSGSTGLPKGVEVPHRGLTDYCAFALKHYYSAALSGSLVVASHTFDLTIPSLYLPLLAGGCVELTSWDEPLRDLAGKLSHKEAGAYLLRLTPLHIQGLLDLIPATGGYEQQHAFVIGGEEFTPALAVRLQQTFPNAIIYNHYGPTETVVGCTIFNVSEAYKAGSLFKQKLPIGQPMANTSVYVLNKAGRQVPVGVFGELHVGGPCVAKGYLNLPELTGQKFINDPFNAGGRLYKTGDSVRWLPSGNLEFLGRIDGQVKIRGHRVEPGEIEHCLSAIVGGQPCMVLAPQNTEGDRQLVAFVNMPAEQLNTQQLRSALSEQLPEYMVPAFFVPVTEWPRTSHGKVDKKALLALDLAASPGQEFVAPRNEHEERLAGIFAEVLKRDTVGIHDSFFDLGGHSLLATRCISLIRQELKIEVQLRMLFENPTVARLAALLDAQKDELVVPDIDVLENRERMPLSYGQKRLWFIDQLEGGSPHYNLPGAFTIEGALDLDAFKHAFQAIIERHQVLRTHYGNHENEAVQLVQNSFELPITEIDLSALEAGEQEQELKRLSKQDASRAFDLSKDLMIRLHILKLSPFKSAVLFNVHHIASDGWSKGILIKEFSALYKAYARGLQMPLPPLAIQYADYASWQLQCISGNMLQKQLSYWKERLKGIPTVHNLPLDKARPKEQSYHGKRHHAAIDEITTAKVKKYCQAQGVTLFMFLQSAFAVLLSKYSNEKDIVVGTPIAGRSHKKTEDLIGFFVNSLALRTDLSADPDFAGLLAVNKQHILDAYTHQHIPFEMLVKELNPERNMGHSPIFQVLLVLQNNEQFKFKLPDLKLRPLDDETFVIKFDLELSIIENEEELSLSWTYNCDLFNSATIGRMAGHFDVLLNSILTDPSQNVSQLQMVSATEQVELTLERNKSVASYHADKTIHALFEEQVRLKPENTALVFEGESLTYAGLNQQANRLAHYLIKKGIVPGNLVGICVERSAAMIVCVLGILKAGGAYLPIDPAYPNERKSHMLSDSQIKILLTEQAFASEFSKSEAEIILLEESNAALAGLSPENPGLELSADQLAYVIYTSGSSGLPKGVLIGHQNVNRLFQSTAQLFDFKESDVWTCFHSLAFDFTVWEIWGALFHGATLVIVPYFTARSPMEFHKLLRREKVTVLNQTPSAFKQLIKADASVPDSQRLALRYVVFGGEALDFGMLKQWYKRYAADAPQLVNMYGITETTVHTTHLNITGDMMNNRGSNIGKVLPDLSYYILDAGHAPVPVGVAGELYIGGPGLASGYLSRPELTAERFIADPFMPGAGSRLYKTGDLVRGLEDGSLEYMGRIDEQVKIRGFRIELGEIESRLRAIPSIKECAVLVKKEKDGNDALAAYIVTDKEDTGAQEIKNELQRHLPAYMVPSHYVKIDRVPLTPHGKLDKRQLLEMGTAVSSGRAYVAPRNELEELLAYYFSSLLHVEQVGIHDNFFELGGHSLLATQLISMIRQDLRIELPLRLLFNQGSIEGIAATLEGGAKSLLLPDITVLEKDGNRVLSFAQQRLWFIDRLEGGSAQYNIPGAFKLEGKLNRNALKQTIHRILERHEVLRTNIRESEGEAIQLIADHFELPLQEEDLSTLGEDAMNAEIRRLAREEAAKPFNLAGDLLIRFHLVQLGGGAYILMYNMHHIASDGWSMNVIAQEFCTLYAAYCHNQPDPLPALKVQYADYANWQRSWLHGDLLDEHMDYWKKQLDGIPAVHNLPLDKPRPLQQSYEARSFKQKMPSEKLEQVYRYCSEAGVTLFMLLETAFAALLSRYSNETDIVIGTPIAGRTHKDTEDLIGLFINTLALRTSLDGSQTFETLLAGNKQTILDAYNYQHVPYEMLVEMLKPERNLAYNPICQVKFVLQNHGESQVELPGLKLAYQEREITKIRFDLDLTVTEKNNHLRLDWTYKTELFEKETIERMATSFMLLIDQVLERENRPVNSFKLISAAEEELLASWQGATDLQDRDLCLHQRFERQAALTPKAIAVSYLQQTLTYEMLSQKAGRLARYLADQDIGRGKYVGVYLERSADLLVCLLGILKSGAAYVPLDPRQKGSRLAHMISDASIELVLVQEHLVSHLPLSAIDIFVLGESAAHNDWLSEYESEEGLLPENEPADAAYVIYTSGSTGMPKGVEVAHSGLTDYCAYALSHYYRPGLQGSVVVTAHCFDITIPGLFLPLLAGGTVSLAAQHDELAAFSEILLNETTADCLLRLTPLHIHGLLALLPREMKLPQAHVFVIGGAPFPKDLADALQLYFPNAMLYNHYGPTEAVVGCAIFPVTGNPQAAASGRPILPIGKPMPNTSLYVLNHNMQYTPLGVAGELFIAGPCLAKGYINQPGLSAEKFIDHFFDGQPTQRLYRTGDLARWLPGGNLEYVGRTDEQVKIRGYRIEPGEIESHLSKIDGVSECAVLAKKDEEGTASLVAYIVAGEKDPGAKAIKAALAKVLPDYMIPSSIVSIGKLPLTRNGKIDRKALLAIEHETVSARQYVAPRTIIEKKLAAVYGEVLNVKQVGLNDDFFELGGHSILVVKLLNKLYTVFDLQLDIRVVFDCPVVEDLALKIADKLETANSQGKLFEMATDLKEIEI